MIKKTLLAVLALSSAMAMASSSFACSHEGTVKFFNEVKGFGFIKEDSTGKEYFFHVSGLINKVAENDAVCFDLQDGKKGMNAVNIKLI